MEDQLQKIWLLIEPRLRVVVFVFFAILLGVVVAIKMSEGIVGVSFDPTTKKKKTLSFSVAAADKLQQQLYTTSSLLSAPSRYNALVKDSMFEVKELSDVDKQADEKYKEAEKLFQQQQYQDALAKNKEVLAFNPNHSKAKALEKEILQKTGGDKPAAVVPSVAPAAVPGVPPR
jgi:superfamily II DNA or RNA helicase